MAELFPESMLIAFFAVLGVCMGSFGNVIIFRVPEHRTIGGRSACMTCKRVLGFHELVPVLSFLFQRGRCRGCGQGLSIQYPLVEIATAFVFVYAIMQFPLEPVRALFFAFALWLLLLIAVIDGRTSLIPDVLSIPLLVIALLLQFMHGSFAFSGVLLGAGFFAVQWIVSRGVWVGSGDIVLGAGIGALLVDWQNVAIFLFFSYVIGAAIACLLILLKYKTMKDALPFGPLLVLGAFLAILFGEAIRGFMMF